MASKITLKNLQDQEFSITHPDGAGAVSIDSNDIFKKSETESNIASFNKGMKNLLINSSFKVNQRTYVSGTNTTTTNQYCHDRWRVVTLGQNVTFTETNGVVTVTAPAGGYEQIIENINNIGGNYVVSNEGTASVSVYTSTDNITYTQVTPANGVYAITGGTYIKVKFTSGTIRKPQFEKGTISTAWEERLFGTELSLCQRYFSKGLVTARGYAAGPNVLISVPFYYPVSMRVVPTVNLTDGGGRSNLYSVVVGTPGFDVYSNRLEITAAASGDFRALHDIWTASAEL